MDLQTLANLTQVVGSVTIVSGAVFGLVQLGEYRRQRRELIVSELMRSFHEAEFARAVAFLQSLPDAASAEALRAQGKPFEEAAVIVATKFETMGLYVFRRIADFDLVQDLVGGICVVMERKLRPWIAEVRERNAQPSFAEWFEWLARQLERSQQGRAPAHRLHADWRP